MVQVACFGPDLKEEGVGSGLYFINNEGKPQVETNAHVVLSRDGKYYGCNIYFPIPENGGFYESSYRTGSVFLYHDLVSVVDSVKKEGLDYAILDISEANKDPSGKSYVFPPDKKDPYLFFQKLCKKSKNIEIGTKIYLIGYPNTGGNSLTLTEGIVSGFDEENSNYIKISASTNYGNSGGVVIGQNDGCYYGVLDRATFEKGSNLGWAIAKSYINDFLNGLTDEKMYQIPASTTKADLYLTKSIQFKDFSLNIPKEWEVATSTNKETGHLSTIFSSPKESAIDDFHEAMILEITPADGDIQKAFEKRLASMKSALDKSGYEYKEGVVKIDKDIDVYRNIFFDKDGISYGSPAYILNSLFAVNDRVILMTGVIGSDSTFSEYKEVYKNIVNSIKFK